MLEPPSEPSEGLLSFEAHLTVRSSIDAEVVVQGVLTGRTNSKLQARCGMRNIRLRGADGAWMTPGDAVRVACLRHTTITLEPR